MKKLIFDKRLFRFLFQKFVGEIKKEEKAEIKEIAAEAKKAKTAVKRESRKAIKRVKEEGAPEGKTLKRQRASGRRVGGSFKLALKHI